MMMRSSSVEGEKLATVSRCVLRKHLRFKSMQLNLGQEYLEVCASVPVHKAVAALCGKTKSAVGVHPALIWIF